MPLPVDCIRTQCEGLLRGVAQRPQFLISHVLSMGDLKAFAFAPLLLKVRGITSQVQGTVSQSTHTRPRSQSLNGFAVIDAVRARTHHKFP